MWVGRLVFVFVAGDCSGVVVCYGGKGGRKNRRLSTSFEVLAGEGCGTLVLFACSDLGRVIFVSDLSIVVGTKEASLSEAQ